MSLRQNKQQRSSPSWSRRRETPLAALWSQSLAQPGGNVTGLSTQAAVSQGLGDLARTVDEELCDRTEGAVLQCDNAGRRDGN